MVKGYQCLHFSCRKVWQKGQRCKLAGFPKSDEGFVSDKRCSQSTSKSVLVADFEESMNHCISYNWNHILVCLSLLSKSLGTWRERSSNTADGWT